MDQAYDPQNIFARLLRNEIPSERVYEDERTVAFMDLMPQAEGHVLVIPREPAVTLLDFWSRARRPAFAPPTGVARAVKRAFEVPGIMIMQVNGAVAGQSVPHIHFHVIPRRVGEALLMHAAIKADAQRLRDNAELIRRCLNDEGAKSV